MIKQVHNLLTVHDNLWTLKLDNFSELKNVIGDNSRPPPPHRPTSLSHIAYQEKCYTLWAVAVISVRLSFV